MKTLYLVRHAKSSWDFPHLKDFDRPLNKRGLRDAPEMGKRLRQRGVTPDIMVSSPANRALTTSKKIAEIIEYPQKAIEKDMRMYHASEHDLFKILLETSDVWNSIMLFGHNPGFTWFANELAGTDIDNIPTCGIFGCEFDVNSWADIKFGTGQLLFFDYPKLR